MKPRLIMLLGNLHQLLACRAVSRGHRQDPPVVLVGPGYVAC
ncbi:hypothetical protein [Fibrella forsythiae]|nr:hypothetical protein [Fibrella forsythiae]